MIRQPGCSPEQYVAHQDQYDPDETASSLAKKTKSLTKRLYSCTSNNENIFGETWQSNYEVLEKLNGLAAQESIFPGEQGSVNDMKGRRKISKQTQF